MSWHKSKGMFYIITEKTDKMGMRKHKNKKEKIPSMTKYKEFLYDICVMLCYMPVLYQHNYFY